MATTLRFQDALPIAIKFIEDNYTKFGTGECMIIRDIYGKIRVFLQAKPTKKHQKLAEELSSLLGNFGYPANAILLYANDFFDTDSIINSPDKIKIQTTRLPIYLLDRQITGQDWSRGHINDEHPPRVTLFGIKGGVGRSTALAIWAWYLANKGKKVLVVDLDLESPGIGQILLPDKNVADFGVVDWLVENAVGQADEWLVREMVATSPLGKSCEGEIRVVAAAGSKEQDYLAKLSRVYMDITIDGKAHDFAHRLAGMLRQLEQQEKPDIVLLDSRAGLHDIAAIAITRLSDLALLFAVNTPQTWHAYSFLFSHWQQWQTNLSSFRNNLQIVAGMIPESDDKNYLIRCKESAYNLFSETIYEEIAADEEGFNFDLNSEEAPHLPLEILWNMGFQEFNPTSADYFKSNKILLEGCYESFLDRATQLAFKNIT